MALIDAKPFNGSRKDFAKRIQRSPAQVAQWLSGHRKLGDTGARLIVLALELPSDYFETKSPVIAEDVTPYPVKVQPLPEREAPEIAEVVAMMRAVDDKGRAMALGAVKAVLAGYKPAKANRAS